MKRPVPTTVYTGTSNIVLPLRQRDFPPEFKGASRLTYYAALFSSVEINATFYKLPQAKTIDHWRDSVPDDFRFTFKLSKTVTHAKDLQFSPEEVERFAETVNRVGSKKGCLLIQLPPKATRELGEEFEGLLESLRPETKGWKIAVEFRHPSWYEQSTYQLLQRYGAGAVLHDKPAAPNPHLEVAPDFVYLRFHGPSGNYRDSYEDAFIEAQAARIRQWTAKGKEVYVYFNNTAGDALGNLQTLNTLLEKPT